jgi:hypothetical protein
MGKEDLPLCLNAYQLTMLSWTSWNLFQLFFYTTDKGATKACCTQHWEGIEARYGKGRCKNWKIFQPECNSTSLSLSC